MRNRSNNFFLYLRNRIKKLYLRKCIYSYINFDKKYKKNILCIKYFNYFFYLYFINKE